jgi:Uma2 family endonuclease
MSTDTITTAEQLWKNPPQGRCELVRGELRMMSPAGSEHGWVVMNIAAPLTMFVKERQLGYVFGAETGFVIHRGPDSVRAPDIAFVRRDRVERGVLPREHFPGPPDLAIEVLSPSDTSAAIHEKAKEWLAAGCQEVWLVDPQRHVALECTLSDDGVVVRRSVERLQSRFLSGFALPVAELFKP